MTQEITAQKIIALVDGSPYSASVCDHAAWISARTNAPVELLHVLGRRESAEKSDLSGSIALGARTALLEELAELDAQRAKLVTHRGRAILEDAYGILTKDGVSEITTRLRHGDLVDTVAEVETDAGMILIGKRGEAADFARGHLGSNLERIVRASRKPVMVADRAFSPIETVLIAYDGGAASMKAVEYVAQSPMFAGLEFQLVTVGEATPAMQSALDTAKARLDAAGRNCTTHIIPGQPEAALSAHVEAQGIDMIVMGPNNHSRLRRLFIGSTTSEMIRACKVPVVLVR